VGIIYNEKANQLAKSALNRQPDRQTETLTIILLARVWLWGRSTNGGKKNGTCCLPLELHMRGYPQLEES